VLGGYGKHTCLPFLHPLKGTLSREKVILLRGKRFFLATSNRERDMLSGQASEVSISTIAAFSTGLVLSFLYCTMHPSGSRLFGRINPPVRRSRARKSPKATEIPPAHSNRKPLSATADPENRRFQAVSKRIQHLWLGTSIAWLTAWSVKMQDLGFTSGVERLTNQRSWLFQHKNGFPVPAQSNYRNILSSLNTT